MRPVIIQVLGTLLMGFGLPARADSDGGSPNVAAHRRMVPYGLALSVDADLTLAAEPGPTAAATDPAAGGAGPSKPAKAGTFAPLTSLTVGYRLTQSLGFIASDSVSGQESLDPAAGFIFYHSLTKRLTAMATLTASAPWSQESRAQGKETTVALNAGPVLRTSRWLIGLSGAYSYSYYGQPPGAASAQQGAVQGADDDEPGGPGQPIVLATTLNERQLIAEGALGSADYSVSSHWSVGSAGEWTRVLLADYTYAYVIRWTAARLSWWSGDLSASAGYGWINGLSGASTPAPPTLPALTISTALVVGNDRVVSTPGAP